MGHKKTICHHSPSLGDGIRNHTMRIFLTICLSILFLPAWPQQDKMMVGAGIGLNRNVILDEYHSPVPYRGIGYMLQLGLNVQNERYYNQLTMIYQKSKISPDINNNSAAHLYRGSIDWIRTYLLKSDAEKWMIYLGFHILSSYDATSHTKWPNNSYSHCLAINLGPSLVMDYAPWTPEVHFYWELSVPVLNYIVRPSLGSILPEGSIRRSLQDIWGVFSGGNLTSLHEYQRICSNLYMSFRDSHGFNIRLGYQWGFQNYPVNNHYQSAYHLLYMAVYYRIKI